MGTCAMTYDQCDHCWGSGDASRPFPSVQKLEYELKKSRLEATGDWLLDVLNSKYIFGHKNRKAMTRLFEELHSFAEKRSRRRKELDDDEKSLFGSLFFYNRSWEAAEQFVESYLLKSLRSTKPFKPDQVSPPGDSIKTT